MGISPGDTTIHRPRIPIPRPKGAPPMRVEQFEAQHIDSVLDWADDDTLADLAAAGGDPRKQVMDAVHRGQAWVVFQSDRPVICIGVVAGSLLSQEGFVWLLCCRGAGFMFARYAQFLLSMLMERYPKLWGTVDPSRRRALRFVQWAGGTITDETVCINGVDHRRFTLGDW